MLSKSNISLLGEKGMKPSDIKRYIHSALEQSRGGKRDDDDFDFEGYVSMVDSYFFGNFLKDSGKFSVVKNSSIDLPFRYLDEDDGKVIIEYNPSKMNSANRTTPILEDIDMYLVQLVCELYVEKAGKKSKSRKKSLRVTKKSINCLYTLLFEDEYLLLELGPEQSATSLQQDASPVQLSASPVKDGSSSVQWSAMPSPSPFPLRTQVAEDLNDSNGDKIDIFVLVAQKIKQLTDIHFRGERILKKKF